MQGRWIALGTMVLAGGCEAYDRGVYQSLRDGAHVDDVRDDPHPADATAPDAHIEDLDGGSDGAWDTGLDGGTDAGLDAVSETGPVVDAQPPVDEPVVERDVPASPDVATPTDSGHGGADAGNQLTNASFESTTGTGLGPWFLYVHAGASATWMHDTTTPPDGRYDVRVDVPAAGGQIWYVQVAQNNHSVVIGQTYTLSFSMRSSVPGHYEASVQQALPPNAHFATYFFDTTTSWQRFSLTFTSPGTETDCGVDFSLAEQPATVWIDNVILTR